MPKLAQLVDEYLASTPVSRNNEDARGTAEEGDRHVWARSADPLAVGELRAWRSTLPPAPHGTSLTSLRQVLAYAVDVGLLDANPAKQIPNPEPKRTEVLPFAQLSEVEAVADELLPHYRTIPIVGALTGLKPSDSSGSCAATSTVTAVFSTSGVYSPAASCAVREDRARAQGRPARPEGTGRTWRASGENRHADAVHDTHGNAR